MKRFAALLVCSAVFVMSYSLHGEVYLLGRGSGAGSAVSKFTGTDIKPLHTEKVRCGNFTLDLEIYRLSGGFSALLARLKSDPQVKITSNTCMLRYRKEYPSKVTEHLLVTDTGKGLLAFRIVTPSNFSANRHWHPELPDLPGGAVSELVLELPSRKAVFGMFNNSFGSAKGNLRAITSNLSSEWHAVADESLMPNGSGSVFTGKNGKVLLVGFSEDGTGFFYLKKSGGTF